MRCDSICDNVDSVDRRLGRIITQFDNDNLSKINNFLKIEICSEFCFDKEEE